MLIFQKHHSDILLYAFEMLASQMLSDKSDVGLDLARRSVGLTGLRAKYMTNMNLLFLTMT